MSVNVKTQYRAKCRECDWWEATCDSQGDAEDTAEAHIEDYLPDNSRPHLSHEVEITSVVLVTYA